MVVKHTDNAFLQKALAKVESQSIRAWATCPQNLPLFEALAESLERKGKSIDGLAGFIVAKAIGLID